MSDQLPYIALGKHLKYMREQSKQSLAEVSGAIEIDEQQLEQIEAGYERPEEDVLMLMISHFNVQDREAVQLWELAEYDSSMPEEIRFSDSVAAQNKPVVMMLAIDVRTMYSDGLDVMVNQSGVTMHFTQMSGQNQAAPVARVGMSHEQAEKVLKTLQQALLKAKYTGHNKMLPPPQETQ